MGIARDLAAKLALQTDTTRHANPYYPLGVEIVDYLAISYSVPVMLVLFFGGMAVLLYLTSLVVKRAHPKLSDSERWTTMWFVLSMLDASVLTIGYADIS